MLTRRVHARRRAAARTPGGPLAALNPVTATSRGENNRGEDEDVAEIGSGAGGGGEAPAMMGAADADGGAEGEGGGVVLVELYCASVARVVAPHLPGGAQGARPLHDSGHAERRGATGRPFSGARRGGAAAQEGGTEALRRRRTASFFSPLSVSSTSSSAYRAARAAMMPYSAPAPLRGATLDGPRG